MATLAAETATVTPEYYPPTDNLERPALEVVISSLDPYEPGTPGSKAEQYARESQLIQQTREGNVEAYGELYKLHRNDLLNIARHLLACNDINQAEDMVQEVFIRTLKALQTQDSFKDFGSGLGPYMTRILQNAVKDLVKSATNRKVMPWEPLVIQEHATVSTGLVEAELTIEDAVLRREDFLLAMRALNSLTQGQRFVILGQSFGLTQEELAAKLTNIMGRSVNVGAIKSLHHRAKQKIQAQLQAQEDGA